ncbi:hypothetical protein KUV46_11055 [Thalassovita mediterranea]|nr:hypothetical protein KUV46_11055 [Thalassovita mediterranea]
MAMNRAFILCALRLLPVWLWPVFLRDVAVYLRWRADLPGDMRGRVALAVSRQGRLVVTGYYDDDVPGFVDGADHVLRQPWLSRSIALGADVRRTGILAALSDIFGVDLAGSKPVPQPPFAFDSG